MNLSGEIGLRKVARDALLIGGPLDNLRPRSGELASLFSCACVVILTAFGVGVRTSEFRELAGDSANGR